MWLSDFLKSQISNFLDIVNCDILTKNKWLLNGLPATQAARVSLFFCNVPMSVPVMITQQCSAGWGKCSVTILWQQEGPHSSSKVSKAKHERNMFSETREYKAGNYRCIYDEEELEKTKYYMSHHLKPKTFVFKNCPETSGIPRDLSRTHLSFPSAERTLCRPTCDQQHSMWFGRTPSASCSLTSGRALSFHPFSIISLPSCKVRFWRSI